MGKMEEMRSINYLDKIDRLGKFGTIIICRHGKSAATCCKCLYGERSHYSSKKGMKSEMDSVDYMQSNRKLYSLDDRYIDDSEIVEI